MENNLPKLRFSNFKGSWKRVKLGNVFTQTSNYINPTLNETELWSLTVEKGLTPKTARYNRDFLVKKEDQFKLVSKNEFIYNPMNMTLGAVDLNSTGKEVAVSGYYITMKADEGYDENYLKTWLKSPLAIRMYKSFATGSLIEKQRVQFPTLSLIRVAIPEIKEQKEIGLFFKRLDEIITLNQQELDSLKQTKQGFLQKMFPKEGETVPEVRFDGFTGEWDKTSFKSLAKIRRGLTYKPADVEVTGVRVLRSSNINGDSFILKDDDIFVNPKVVNIEYAKDGEILITSANGSSRLVGKHALIKNVGPKTVHGGFMLIASAVSPYFVNSLMSSSWYDKFINVHVSGGNGAIGNLSKNDLEGYNVFVPSIEEQNKIGEFFKKLDKTIELQEKELEALKETKKAFLQKMFV